MLKTVLADLGTDLFREQYAKTGGCLILAENRAVEGVDQFLLACRACALDAITEAFDYELCKAFGQKEIA
jgi:hypothetical protein